MIIQKSTAINTLYKYIIAETGNINSSTKKTTDHHGHVANG